MKFNNKILIIMKMMKMINIKSKNLQLKIFSNFKTINNNNYHNKKSTMIFKMNIQICLNKIQFINHK
jgi:hypothetical protein